MSPEDQRREWLDAQLTEDARIDRRRHWDYETWPVPVPVDAHQLVARGKLTRQETILLHVTLVPLSIALVVLCAVLLLVLAVAMPATALWRWIKAAVE